MVGSEVLRQRNLRRIVARAKFRGWRPRIVRRGQRDPREKRPLPSALTHKFLRRIAKNLRRKSPANPRWLAAPNFLQIPHRHRRVIAHAAVKNFLPALKRAQQRRQIVVPLAGDKGLIARRTQSLRQRARLRRQWDFKDRPRSKLRLGIGAKDSVTRQQARPRGCAHRRHQAALNRRPRKRRAAPHEAVEHRGLHGQMTERADGVRPVVVDNHEKDVGVGKAGAKGHRVNVWRSLQ